MADLFKETSVLRVSKHGVECKVPKAQSEFTISVQARDNDGRSALCQVLHALLHLADEQRLDFETELALARHFCEQEEREWGKWLAAGIDPES
jgi:hypothetical protein